MGLHTDGLILLGLKRFITQYIYKTKNEYNLFYKYEFCSSNIPKHFSGDFAVSILLGDHYLTNKFCIQLDDNPSFGMHNDHLVKKLEVVLEFFIKIHTVYYL